MSLKGLGKDERHVHEVKAEDFIKGATKRVASLKIGKERTYERCMFSLTSEVSKEIDRLSLVPRDFRASRSDVVKAAIAAFAALPEAEQLKQLKQLI